METERTLELLKDFQDNGIVHKGDGLKKIIEYQDCIMQANNSEVSKFERELDKPTRQLFFWVNANTLGMDSFLDILKSTYIHRKGNEFIQKEADEINKQYNEMFTMQQRRKAELEKKELAFEIYKKPIHKKIADLRNTVRQLSDSLSIRYTVIDKLEEENTKLRRWAKQNAEKAEKYDNIKSLLS